MSDRDESLRAIPILVADDDDSSRKVLMRLLAHDGYDNVAATGNPREVVERVHDREVKLLLLDLHMPGKNGLEVMADLRESLPERRRPQILVMTGDQSLDARHRSLDHGVADFVTKPFNSIEVLLRVRNLLRGISLQQEIERQNEILEEQVRLRTAELDHTQVEVLERLARAAEYRDDDSGPHTRRVANMSALIAGRLGLQDSRAELIRRASLLHDIGKIGLTDAVLLSTRRLTDQERALMEQHTLVGGSILGGSSSPLLQLAEQIALSHHEWWDGSGYPYGLVGEDIPLAGRIVAVADTFDALMHERPYKPAWTLKATLTEITELRGLQFDPAVVDALLDLVTEARQEVGNGDTPSRPRAVEWLGLGHRIAGTG